MLKPEIQRVANMAAHIRMSDPILPCGDRVRFRDARMVSACGAVAKELWAISLSLPAKSALIVGLKWVGRRMDMAMRSDPCDVWILQKFY